MVEPEWPQMTI